MLISIMIKQCVIISVTMLSCISTDVLPVHGNSFPPVGIQVEEQVSEMWAEAGRIVGRMKTSQSVTAALFTRLKQNLCCQEKDEVREKLKTEMSRALTG